MSSPTLEVRADPHDTASGATAGSAFGAATRAAASWRRVVAAACLAVAVIGCTSSTATPIAPTSSVAGATATPTTTATATPTATATATPTPTATPSPTPTPPPTPKPTPAPTAKPTPTPLPPLAIGLCTGAQLSLSITLWEPESGSGVYAHITATNVSSASCNMRGTPRIQMIDGNGSVLTDSGSGEISTGDQVYTLAPNDGINTIVDWVNWCKSAPAQKVTVAVVMPFGLGKFVAPANGDGPIPACYSSGSGATVSAEAWLP